MKSAFSEQNLARYKMLASGALTADERKSILDCLAAELAQQRCLAMAKSCGTD